MVKGKIKIAAIFFLVCSLILGTGVLAAGAAGSITVYGNVTKAGNSVNLGFMIVEVPPGALTDGDTMAMTLPDGFSFNAAQPVWLSSSLNNTSESTVSVVYPSIGGRPNAIDGIISADYLGSNTLKITVNGNPLPNQKAILYIYMKGIKTPSNYRGEVGLKIAGNSGWPSSSDIEPGDENDLPKEEPTQALEPDKDTNITEKVNASFRIGEPSYTVDGSARTMDAAPFIRDGRTYVPVRYAAMAAGIPEENISYQNGTVTIKHGDNWVKLLPGDRHLETNRGIVMMDVPLIVEKDRTYLPIRWICEAFQLKVTWVDESQTVVIQN